MPTTQGRIAGMLEVAVNGEQLRWVGDFEYNLGIPENEGMLGSSGWDGFKEKPQIPYISGQVRNMPNLDLAALLSLKDATIVARLANGKGVVLSGAYHAGPGTARTEDSTIDVRFEGATCEEFTL